MQNDRKGMARELLKGRFGVAVVACLAASALYILALLILDSALMLAGIIDYDGQSYVFTELAFSLPVMLVFVLVVVLMHLTLTLPLRFGVKRWFFALAHDAYPAAETLFFGFKKEQYGRSIGLSLRFFLKGLLFGALCGLPGIMISTVGALAGDGVISLADASEASTAIFSFGITVFAAGIVASRIICMRYFLAPYLLGADPKLTPKEAMRLSDEAMKGKKAGLFRTVLSFVGLFALTVPTFGILLIYTVPYFNTVLALYAKDCITEAFSVKEEASTEETAENAD